MLVRIFSYRNKRQAKKVLIVLAILAALIFSVCLIRFIYLQRYLVYVGDQVTLDFEQDLGREPRPDPPSWAGTPVEIIMEAPVEQEVASTDTPMTKLRGYYITMDMLQNVDKVTEEINKLENPQAILMDLKSIYGNFYYSSGTYGATKANADIDAIDRLIESLAARDHLYLIARIPSLSDNNFALANQSSGLPLRSGALWMDRHACYWLDPMSTTVQEYLASIAEELAAMGFDEVVFDQFEIPGSENIVYSSELSREEAAAEAANALKTMLENTPIRVSFGSSNEQVAAHSDRIYLATNDGSSVASLVESVKEPMEDPSVQIVFLTASRDTRFNDYGVLRPVIEGREE